MTENKGRGKKGLRELRDLQSSIHYESTIKKTRELNVAQ